VQKGNAPGVAVGGMVDTSKYKKDGPYRIGFSNGFSGNTWRTMMIASLKKEAAKHPEISDLIIVDGQGDIAKQVSDIESLIAQQVDAILCIANSGSAVAPALKQAYDNGIVTIPFNLPVDGEDWTAYTGTNPENKGKVWGEWLVQKLGGKGKIIALGGIPGNSYTAAAWGASEAIIKQSQIEVLAFKDAHWAEDKAKEVTADLLAAYPEINGVWCDGAQDGAGAMKAFLAASRPLVPVTGDDYNGLLKIYMENKEKYPNFDVGLLSEPTYESRIALQMALSALKGEPIARQWILQPALITGELVPQFVQPDLPDGLFVDTDLSDEEVKAIFTTQG